MWCQGRNRSTDTVIFSLNFRFIHQVLVTKRSV
jgi:hypothetical protein